MHKHKCPSCAHIWEHETAALRGNKELYDAAHHCPRCGTEQFYKHFEPDERADSKEIMDDFARLMQMLLS